MQDPLHYPHGTKWMAPGPLGQVHPLPDDDNIKLEMMRVARNHKHIYDMYNFGERVTRNKGGGVPCMRAVHMAWRF
jgi:hypothetical protein